MKFDLAVIGAGPAGASAAFAAAELGMSVALIERQILPRHKTCGGGMPITVDPFIRGIAPDSVVECQVSKMRHTFNFADPYLGNINPNEAESKLGLWMVQRSIFDNALTKRAETAGAKVYDGTTVQSVMVEDKSVRITGKTSQSSVEIIAATVIGADGANGITARASGLSLNRTLAIAIEVEHPHIWGIGHQDLQPEICHLEYGAVQNGYAWVFPKGDHLNVGAGIFRPRTSFDQDTARVKELLHSTISKYLLSLGVEFDSTKATYYAHSLPLWNGKQRLNTRDGRIMLTGDAASLINPIFGDGILNAIKSGVIAGTCAAENEGTHYTKRVHAELAQNFDAAKKLSAFFYQFPGICYNHAVKRPNSTRTATRLISGEALFTDIAAKALRRLQKAVLSGE